MTHLDYAQAKLIEAQEQIKTMRDAGGGEQDFVRLALEALEAALRYTVVELRELHRLAAEAERPAVRAGAELPRTYAWPGDDPNWRPWPVVVRDVDAKLDRILELLEARPAAAVPAPAPRD